MDQRLKINPVVCRRDILEAVVLAWAQRHFVEASWTFQQAYKAEMTQDWCTTHFPDFISSAEWPPYLNPMDYSVWSILEDRAQEKFGSAEAIVASGLRSIITGGPAAENFK